MRNIILFGLIALCPSANGQTPNAREILSSAIIPYRSLSYESAVMNVTETHGRRESTEEYSLTTVRDEGGTITVLESRAGKKLILKTENGEFISPASYIRRRGAEEQEVSTRNPASYLPHIGLQFSDVLDYLLVRELEQFQHRIVREKQNCTIIRSDPLTEYVISENKQFDVCGVIIREIRYYNSAGNLLKTIRFENFLTGSVWWRPQRIVVEDFMARLTVTVELEYTKTGG